MASVTLTILTSSSVIWPPRGTVVRVSDVEVLQGQRYIVNGDGGFHREAPAPAEERGFLIRQHGGCPLETGTLR